MTYGYCFDDFFGISRCSVDSARNRIDLGRGRSNSKNGMILHITNGECVVHSFRDTRLEGDYLSWTDLLYEGPVPQPMLDELAPIRAHFIADVGWEGYQEALARLSSRNDKLKSFRRYDEVVLWFEHDLTDQLQLIQVLDWFQGRELGPTGLSLININTYPGIASFHGLGQLTGQQLLQLLPTRKAVNLQQLSIGRDAWQAFCAPEPSALLSLLGRDLSALPFLTQALCRFLEEYPSVHNGLSRTEQQILLAAVAGRQMERDIYVGLQEGEDARFMGDRSVWLRVDRLAAGPTPALEASRSGTYLITDQGRSLVDGKVDWIKHRGGIDLWLGGVHLQGKEGLWRWDPQRQTLIAS